jgi:hypothetical protein
MLRRRRSNPSSILEFYLEKEAVNLRKQLKECPLAFVATSFCGRQTKPKRLRR